MSSKQQCKVSFKNPKAQKACKQQKTGKARCIEGHPPAMKKKCALDPSGGKGGKGNKGAKWQGKGQTERKIFTVGGIVLVIIVALFAYSLVKGVGFIQQNPQLLAALA